MVPKLLFFSLVVLGKCFLLHKMFYHGELFLLHPIPKLLHLPWEMPCGQGSLGEVNGKALEEQVLTYLPNSS